MLSLCIVFIIFYLPLSFVVHSSGHVMCFFFFSFLFFSCFSFFVAHLVLRDTKPLQQWLAVPLLPLERSKLALRHPYDVEVWRRA